MILDVATIKSINSFANKNKKVEKTTKNFTLLKNESDKTVTEDNSLLISEVKINSKEPKKKVHRKKDEELFAKLKKSKPAKRDTDSTKIEKKISDAKRNINDKIKEYKNQPAENRLADLQKFDNGSLLDKVRLSSNKSVSDGIFTVKASEEKDDVPENFKGHFTQDTDNVSKSNLINPLTTGEIPYELDKGTVYNAHNNYLKSKNDIEKGKLLFNQNKIEQLAEKIDEIDSKINYHESVIDLYQKFDTLNENFYDSLKKITSEIFNVELPDNLYNFDKSVATEKNLEILETTKDVLSDSVDSLI